MTAIAHISIPRKVNKPDKVWRFTSGGIPLLAGPGVEYILTIKSGRETLRYSTNTSPGLTYDATSGILRWERSLEESLKIASGRRGDYEIIRITGPNKRLLVKGDVTGVEGL